MRICVGGNEVLATFSVERASATEFEIHCWCTVYSVAVAWSEVEKRSIFKQGVKLCGTHSLPS